MRSTLLLVVLAAAPCHAAESGAAIFAENCAMCHQQDGAGAAGVAPSLAGTLKQFATMPGGKQYLSQILISGMVGPIETQGHKFSGLMPSFSDKLSDAQAASVLGYVLATFNGVQTPVITAQNIAAARAANPSPNDTHHVRKALFSSE